MTQVDFYILSNDTAHGLMHYACRIAAKAYRLGNSVFIHTDSAKQTRELDKLLWTFEQNSFVPHASCEEDSAGNSPVLLSHQLEPDASREVLINLANDVPLFFSRFERVAELINKAPDTLQQGRRRYSFYRERGYPLKTHEIRA